MGREKLTGSKPGRGHVVLGDEVTPGFGEKRSEADGLFNPDYQNS